ncbi:MAG: signal recognition particle-docking protein FtsY [Anaerolineales bacterium]|nr:signal recognition particle-docking protein FtsY [Anaerolineales bacterium]
MFKSLRDSLSKTRDAVFGRVATLLGQTDITAATWDELEATLIQADVGAKLAAELVSRLKGRATAEGIIRAEALKRSLKAELVALLGENRKLQLCHRPTVIALVGVNGSGKTTSAAKLGRYFQRQGKAVMLAAADTFRAAAIDQLAEWGNRLNIPVIAGQPNADPGAVAYDAVMAARARSVDVLLVDTAGRLQSKFNLMEELKKVMRVIGKALPGAPHESLLVLDAVTGQNALSQAHGFHQAGGLTGVILAKLDGSAKGGMAFAIRRELGLPILFVGTGEHFDDFAEFDAVKFVDGLLETGKEANEGN